MGAESQSVRVGTKLRHARRTKGLTLMELAQRVGCSESLLSKIENERVKPSIRVLHKLVSALDTNISHLFQAECQDSDIVLHAGERLCVETDGAGVALESLVPNGVSRLLQATLHTIQPGGTSQGTYEHTGEEVGYVLEGVFELTVGDRSFLLGPGDSFFFRSDQTHGFRNPSDAVTRVVWFNTPPTW